MRKKNIPKSSNDVTDSNSSSNSDDEMEDQTKLSESDEDFQPVKRRRIIRSTASKNDSEDDSDDESYNGNS